MNYQNIKNTRDTFGYVYTVSNIMKNVMGPAVEVEVGDLFYYAEEAEPIHTTHHKMGHTQPATPIQTEDYAANVIANNIVRQKTIKIHVYALLLETRSNHTRPFSCLLETRHRKPRRSFFHESRATPPHINAYNIPSYRCYIRERFCRLC